MLALVFQGNRDMDDGNDGTVMLLVHSPQTQDVGIELCIHIVRSHSPSLRLISSPAQAGGPLKKAGVLGSSGRNGKLVPGI